MGNIPTFRSRADAFDYMLATLCEKGVDLMEAAQKAEAFAEIVARNRALPDAPKSMLGKCMDTLKQVSELKRQYPDAWDAVSGIVGGIFGAIAGSKAAESAEEPMAEPIDFNTLDDATQNNDSGGL